MPESFMPYDSWKNPVEELREFVDSLPEEDEEDMEDYCLKKLYQACRRVGIEDELIISLMYGLDEYGPALDGLRQAFRDHGINDVDAYLEKEFGLPNEKKTNW